MIKVFNHQIKTFSFPAGERGCVITDGLTYGDDSDIGITLEFNGSDDIIDLLNVVNALRNRYGQNQKLVLFADYLPFSRQDRVTEYGAAFSLQMFASLIKLCNFSAVYTKDVHSDVAAALFDAGVLFNTPQDEIWYPTVRWYTSQDIETVLISPDAGASKKIYKLAKKANVRVAEASKIRDLKTGNIVQTKFDGSLLEGAECAIIVDDICDGGRTFLELGKVIRDGGYTEQLILCVTHGIFSKGITPEFDMFDAIRAHNCLRPEIRTEIDNFNLRKMNKS